MFHSERAKPMMWRGDGCDVNLVQRYNGSLQVLKVTMLNQQEIFRKQVLELHRLYGVQKMLMKELDLKMASGFNYGKVSTTELIENKYLQGNGSLFLKLQQRSLDLELPASHYIGNYVDEDILIEQRCYSIAKESVKTKHDCCNGRVSSREELELSLRIGGDTPQKSSSKQTWGDKGSCSPSYFITDLEGSSEKASSCRPNFLEKKPFDHGFDPFPMDISDYETPDREKLFASHEAGWLDLNQSLTDGPSFHSIAIGTSCPSISTTSGSSHRMVVEDVNPNATDWKIMKSDCTKESSALVQPNTDFMNTMASRYQNNCQLTAGITPCYMDLKAPSLDSKDPGNHSRNTEPKNADSPFISSDMPVTDMNGQKAKEDSPCALFYTSQEPVEGADSNKSPVSCKSDCMAEDISSNRNPIESGISLRKSNHSPQNSESSQVAKKLFEHNVECSGDSDSKTQLPDPEKGEAVEHDRMVKRGAVSLIYFSLQCLSGNEDCIPNANNGTVEVAKINRDAPQCSSESYESLILKQPESSIDDYCISSAPPFDLNGSKEVDYAKKWKRGRRMKDFQKEILPSLSSLSRQEICEDVRIFQVAIRSREYKKFRSKNDRKENVRSKRPRGRRYCS